MDITQKQFLDQALRATTRLELWERIIEMLAIKTMAEIGVWKGEYAEAVLAHCAAIEKYYMIDPWATLPDWNKPLNVDATNFEHVYREAMARTGFAEGKRVVLRGRTADVIDDIPDNSLDFVYIDGDHTLRGITIDLIKVFPKVRENGFIGCDDFTPNPWQHDVRFEPTLVCPFSLYFAEATKITIVALPFNQCLMQKRTNAAFSFVDPLGAYRDLSLNKLPPGIRILVKELLGRVVRKFLP